MVHKVHWGVIHGRVAGYATGWISISSLAHIVVKVGHDTIRIPIDQRQIKFIQKEHPVGDIVELEYNGGWHILSRATPMDNDIITMLNNIY
ncbi:MAG TPA: hypothetical protein VMC84_01485 [Methanocella sp.]|uniref:hypothetical protein n=1 Tax=Methanocella sp. TaxID=2052833 RepID=UPI002C01DB60|nr:hypothetical protein [Methanocella sp.]HTY89826.1 hypothetical protein [Methanocella sp.]